MKTKLLCIFLTLALLLGAVGCGAAAPASPSAAPTAIPETTPAASESRLFTDDIGRQVALPDQVTRILPSGALAQIILYPLAPELFAGLASDLPGDARGILPDAYFDLTVFGSLYAGAELNVEALALAEPQLIIDIGQSKDAISEDLDTLQDQTGIPAVFLSASLETMPQTYRRLGELLDRQDQAEKLAQFCQRTYDRTLSILEQVGDRKVRCLYVLGEEGLNVIARSSYHAEVLDLLTENLAVVDNPVSKGTGNSVTMEQIALWDPDFVIFGPDSIYDSVADTDTWNQLSANTAGQFVQVPQAPYNWMGMPPSVQRYLGLIWLPAVLYPEYCDYDVESELREYFSLFYCCSLTDAQYAAITAGAFLPPQ